MKEKRIIIAAAVLLCTLGLVVFIAFSCNKNSNSDNSETRTPTTTAVTTTSISTTTSAITTTQTTTKPVTTSTTTTHVETTAPTTTEIQTTTTQAAQQPQDNGNSNNSGETPQYVEPPQQQVTEPVYVPPVTQPPYTPPVEQPTQPQVVTPPSGGSWDDPDDPFANEDHNTGGFGDGNIIVHE